MKLIHRRTTDNRVALSGLDMIGRNDARILRDTAACRFDDDVELFERWVYERYAADRRIGVDLFNSEIVLRKHARVVLPRRGTRTTSRCHLRAHSLRLLRTRA